MNFLSSLEPQVSSVVTCEWSVEIGEKELSEMSAIRYNRSIRKWHGRLHRSTDFPFVNGTVPFLKSLSSFVTKLAWTVQTGLLLISLYGYQLGNSLELFTLIVLLSLLVGIYVYIILHIGGPHSFR